MSKILGLRKLSAEEEAKHAAWSAVLKAYGTDKYSIVEDLLIPLFLEHAYTHDEFLLQKEIYSLLKNIIATKTEIRYLACIKEASPEFVPDAEKYESVPGQFLRFVRHVCNEHEGKPEKVYYIRYAAYGE